VRNRVRVVEKGKFYGLDYKILEMVGSHLCGYVRVPRSHPWYMVDYSTCTLKEHCKDEEGEDTWCCEHSPASQILVHGGITLSDRMLLFEMRLFNRWWLRFYSYWWFGFDCAHAGDLVGWDMRQLIPTEPGAVYRDVSYVRNECTKLAFQLAGVGK